MKLFHNDKSVVIDGYRFDKIQAKDVDDIFEFCRDEIKEMWSKGEIEKSIDNPFYICLKACDCEAIAGAIHFSLVGESAAINFICVRKDKRQKGVGLALLKACKDYCKEGVAKKITLEVRKDNVAAIGLYQKVGFMIAGERKNFYAGVDSNRVDAIVYTIDL